MRQVLFVAFAIAWAWLGSSTRAAITGLQVQRMDFSSGYQMRDESMNDPNGQVSAAWPAFDATYDVYRVYALSNNPNDVVVIVHGSDVDHISLVMRSTSGNFWNHNAGTLHPPFIDDAENDGTLAFDTFLTLGGTDGAASSVMFIGNFGTMSTDFNEENAGWLVFPTSAHTPVNGRVLLAQFAVRNGEAVFGRMGVSIVGGTAAYYTYTSHPAPSNLKLVNYAGALAGDRYGSTVANVGDVNGDGYEDFAVGSPFAGGKGSVKVYSGKTGLLLLNINGEKNYEQFGASIATAGDLNNDGSGDLLVGAPGFSGKKGAVYVISGSNGAKLAKVVGEQKNDVFGSAIAGGVDLNNDGIPDFVVGAPMNDDADTNAGKCYTYTGANFTRIASAVGQGKNHRFGSAVALVVDAKGDQDGEGDVLVGAPWNGEKGAKAGKVYLYSGINFTPTYAILGNAAGDNFGHSLAALGDLNGDGADDFVIGSPFASKGTSVDVGRIDVHSGMNGSRIFVKKGTKAGALFGYAVAQCTDVDGDGSRDIVVGSPRFSTGTPDVGRTFIVLSSTTNTMQVVTGTANEQCGESVAAIGYAGNPQYAAIVAGAWRNDDAGIDAGKVRVGMAPNLANDATRFAEPLTNEGVESWLLGWALLSPVDSAIQLFSRLRDLDNDGRLTIDDVAAALRGRR